jgi:hypothetical protein
VIKGCIGDDATVGEDRTWTAGGDAAAEREGEHFNAREGDFARDLLRCRLLVQLLHNGIGPAGEVHLTIYKV